MGVLKLIQHVCKFPSHERGIEMEEYILQTNKLSKSFGKQLAVDNVSLKVKQTPSTDCLDQTEPANQRL